MAISNVPTVSNQTSTRPASNAAAAPSAVSAAKNEPEAVAPSATEQPARETPKNSDLTEDVSRLNDVIQQTHRKLRFSVDDSTGETIIQVMDAVTEEVVRQIPAREVVNLLRHLQQSGNSLMFSANA